MCRRVHVCLHTLNTFSRCTCVNLLSKMASGSCWTCDAYSHVAHGASFCCVETHYTLIIVRHRASPCSAYLCSADCSHQKQSCIHAAQHAKACFLTLPQTRHALVTNLIPLSHNRDNSWQADKCRQCRSQLAEQRCSPGCSISFKSRVIETLACLLLWLQHRFHVMSCMLLLVLPKSKACFQEDITQSDACHA